MDYHNRMAPFPYYDTEYVSDVKNRIKEMENNDKIDYDSIPVAACKYCHKLRIQQDEYDNDVCMNCGSVNELVIYDTIFTYLDKKRELDESD